MQNHSMALAKAACFWIGPFIFNIDKVTGANEVKAWFQRAGLNWLGIFFQVMTKSLLYTWFLGHPCMPFKIGADLEQNCESYGALKFGPFWGKMDFFDILSCKFF